MNPRSPSLEHPPRGTSRLWPAVWIFFLTAHLVIGAFGLTALGLRTHVTSQSPLSSTDSVLRSLLGVKNGSSKVADCIEGVAANAPIAIVFEAPGGTELAALQLATLIWPHPAPQVVLHPGQALDPGWTRTSPRPFAAFFVGIPPPPRAAARSQQLGSHLHYWVLPASPTD
jgi:hypothetical protein